MNYLLLTGIDCLFLILLGSFHIQWLPGLLLVNKVAGVWL